MRKQKISPDNLQKGEDFLRKTRARQYINKGHVFLKLWHYAIRLPRALPLAKAGAKDGKKEVFRGKKQIPFDNLCPWLLSNSLWHETDLKLRWFNTFPNNFNDFVIKPTKNWGEYRRFGLKFRQRSDKLHLKIYSTSLPRLVFNF